MRSVALVSLALLACGSTPMEQPDAMVGQSYRLERTSAAAFGLGYGEVRTVAVRYLDAGGAPLPGQAIHFRIFGDPQGSTLSADRGASAPDGEAEVHLSAGAAEAQFKVVASAPNAPDVSFDVSVSKFAFIEIDAQLDYNGAEMGSVTTVEARLYTGRGCAKLHAEGPPPAPLRTSIATGAHAVLPLPFLLAVSYAVTGRAVDAKGQLVAWGCVDVDAAQLAATRLTVPVPLGRTALSLAGSWTLTTELAIPSPPASTLGPWHELHACPRAPAQQLLDGIVAAADGKIAPLLQAHRGDVDGSGCRPASASGSPSLDQTLTALLAVQGAPALALAGVAADLDAIVAGGQLTSRLDLTLIGAASDGSSGRVLLADHRLDSLTLHGKSGAVSYALGKLGLPITQRSGVPATLAGGTFSLDKHDFTLRLPSLWARALADLALAPRGLPRTPRLLVVAVVGAARRVVGAQTVTGCAAVEDLLCAAVGVNPCALAAACATSSEALARRLEQSLAPPTGTDLVLGGSATPLDSDADLLADLLGAGTFTADVTVAAPDVRQTLTLPWTGARAQ